MSATFSLSAASPAAPPAPAYAELHCLSNYSFLRAASFPEELVERAIELGYQALALTDECSVAGVVRAWTAVRSATPQGQPAPVKLIVGSEFHSDDGLHLVLLAPDRHAYGQLSAMISEARRRADKGRYSFTRELLETHLPARCLALWVPPAQPFLNRYDPVAAHQTLKWLRGLFPGRLWIAAQFYLDADDFDKREALRQLSEQSQVPVCAAGGVIMHHPIRRALRDTLTAIRLRTPLADLGYKLPPNAQQFMRSRGTLGRLYPAQWLAETTHIAARCQFDLGELRYEYPRELVPEGFSPAAWLRRLTLTGMQERWPDGVPETVRTLVDKELGLIAELGYEHFFLTVHDLVTFARSRSILCQGRGSAANSAVCYCLGITAVDPARMQLLFERFLSKERDEPPDIDVDFEHERREEVIQYIYQKYGRHRAALAATVICYRRRSAIRDVGKALGLTETELDWALNCLRSNSQGELVALEDPQLPAFQLERLVYLVEQLTGFPRHLSQHVGGFVISEGRLAELVPIENAAMSDRTVIQWEKDDLEALGLLKVDVLALGMLTAIRKALALINEQVTDQNHEQAGKPGARPLTLADVPAEDPQVYDMISEADTVGVFQIESRAQMSMLPRLRPRNYYDLVVQIAIVRPGPIQGDMVHPYLRRRQGVEAVTYPSAEVQQVLQRTLGVPIFQEQVMQIAMVAAGFSGGEADQLRRAMAAWKRKGGLEPFRERLIEGMQARGYATTFAEQIYQQIKGFGDYGFPESHSASFALLAYVSAWLKCHHPAAFLCALLNSQPMGFYGASQLVQDARSHGVTVLPVDVLFSEHDSSLQPVGDKPGQLAVRLGLHLVKGLSANAIQRLLQAREQQVFTSVTDALRRAALSASDRDALAAADALSSLVSDRHRAFWDSRVELSLPPLFAEHSQALPESADAGQLLMLPRSSEAQNIYADYQFLGLSLRRHPMSLWREHLQHFHVTTATDLATLTDHQPVKIAGLVTCRQRPQTASGVTFMTLEDETGFINTVVWPSLLKSHYRLVHEASLIGVSGYLQQSEGVTHVIAVQLVDLSHWLQGMPVRSRDFA
ncbi:MAG: error-prone DNA polymerase [Gammaproteobacteria bacterium]|nr:error-prone DNA polymerase [Gammaproteobacteria bacterium]MBJ56607.1 error-prone DNA polymerase [Gammaproteobacteria bacterium]HBN15496.1 error-prone DNA polymerase [Pseudohongiella sp.]